MPIRASSGREIDALVADLSANRPVTREAAVARLTVIGARAVDKLTAVLESSAPSPARVAALQTLEAIASPRALDPALRAIDDRDQAVALAAVSMVRAFLRSARGADVTDRLTQLAVDSNRQPDIRLAAIHVLSDLTAAELKPLWSLLAQDSQAAVRARAETAISRRPAAPTDPLRDVTAAAEGDLPDDPVALGRAISEAARSIALPLLHHVVERIREREAREPPDRRSEWTNARAAAHLALANRGSRLALYDLRESLERATAPLPVEFLAALSLVGDAGCLEAVAAAHAKSGGSSRAQTDWWRQHLASAFQTIVKRERLTRRHALMKRVLKRWPSILEGERTT
jgi:HEAT repeat protein